jgi:hypothetical protein
MRTESESEATTRSCTADALPALAAQNIAKSYLIMKHRPGGRGMPNEERWLRDFVAVKEIGREVLELVTENRRLKAHPLLNLPRTIQEIYTIAP